MKLLSIVRHAKAERPDAYDTDFVRPLARRGHSDSRLIAKILTKIEPACDYVVSSSSLRTRETVQEFTSAMSYEGLIVWSDALYLAAVGDMLRVLSETPDDVEHVVMCGHNPGMEELVAGLCAGSTQHLHLEMPTACCTHLYLQIVHWSQIRWGCGALRFLLPPKLLRM